MSIIGLSLTVAALIAVFPLFSTVYVAVDKNDKSCKFRLSLFGITVFKYLIIADGFTFRIQKSFKKPYSVNLYDFFGKTDYNSVKRLKNISVLAVDLKTDAGANDTTDFALISAIYAAINLIFCTVKANANVKTHSTLNLYYGVSGFCTVMRIKTVFNLLDLLTIFLLNFWGKLKYAIGKQNKQRCRECA